MRLKFTFAKLSQRLVSLLVFAFPVVCCSCQEGISLESSIIGTLGGFWTMLWLNDVAARKKVDTWGSSEVGKGQPRFINPRPSLTISSPYKRRGQHEYFPLSLINMPIKNIQNPSLSLRFVHVCSIEVQYVIHYGWSFPCGAWGSGAGVPPRTMRCRSWGLKGRKMLEGKWCKNHPEISRI